MARKRTRNYREERAPFDTEEDPERRKDEDEEGEEDEEEDEEASAEDEDEEDEGEGEEDEDGEPVAKKPKKKPPPKAPAKPKRTRASKVVRMRVVWGVFNNSNQRVATYEYPKRKEADEHAAKLSADKKQTYFVQPVKEPME